MNASINETARKFVATATTRKERMQALLAEVESGVVDNLFIVRNPRGNVCIQYADGFDKQPRFTTPDLATRYANVNHAKEIAARTFNGADEPAKAVLLSVALVDDIKEIDVLIEQLEQQS